KGAAKVAALNNERHEKFVRGLANGLSQRNTYRAAFPKSVNWKDNTIDARACELAKNSKVLARLEELRAAATSKAVKTAIQRKEWLSEVMDNQSEDMQHRLRACDMLNKMEGEYTDKLTVNGNVNNPFEGLTTDELKKLIGSE
ncbi:MAG: terminase, partial [Clostridia bacterium]|nr:terminase [Clostridia bacterium]